MAELKCRTGHDDNFRPPAPSRYWAAFGPCGVVVFRVVYSSTADRWLGFDLGYHDGR